MEIHRSFAFPSVDTFEVQPIRSLVQKYLKPGMVSIDPFARNSTLATWTNDLNPNTCAQHHVKANVFLQMLKAQGVKADIILFDPPYSHEQAKRVYGHFGVDAFTMRDAQIVGRWHEEKCLCHDLLIPGGFFLHFGWHTNAMVKNGEYEILEILIVAHGGAHNDTLCMVQRKIQMTIYDI